MVFIRVAYETPPFLDLGVTYAESIFVLELIELGCMMLHVINSPDKMLGLGLRHVGCP